MMLRAALKMLLALVVRTGAATPIESRIDATIDEAKIAQLLFVGLSGQAENATLRELVGDRRVGGIVLYAHNIERPEPVRGSTKPSFETRAGCGSIHRH